MALATALGTGIKIGKKLLGRRKKPWKGESEQADPSTWPTTKAARGRGRKPWKGESEQADPSTWPTTKAARTRRTRLGRTIAAGAGAGAGVGAGIGLSKKKPITGAGMDVPKTKGMSSYKVKKGDTLSEIAQKTGTTVKQLKNANPNITNIHKIKVGQTIKIPSKKRNRKSVYEGLKKSEMKVATKKKIKPSISRLKSGGLVGMGAALRGGGAVRSR